MKNQTNASIFYIFWHNWPLVFELVKREFSGRYRGSLGGILWAFFQPLFLLSIYTIAFGVILKTRWGFSDETANSDGTANYALMVFAGLIIFNTFSECVNKSTTLITDNPNFVKKVVFPLELLPVVTVITVLIHALIGIAVWLLGYIYLFGVIKITSLFFPIVLISFIPVLLGLGWLLSALGVIIKDISQMTGMLNHTLLFLTPIFYNIATVPPSLQKLLTLNPLTFVVEQFRLVFFYGQIPDFKGLAMYFTFSCLFAGVSLLLFKRLRPTFADMV